MHLMSCATPTVVETARVVVPDLVFPPFPDLAGGEAVEGGVIVPNDYVIRLAEYRVRIEETERNYLQIKGLYEDEREQD